MKIVIAGGSGHLGTLLARSFYAAHEVVVLSRSNQVTPWRAVGWDRAIDEINGADVVINLAGRSVNCRYHARNREEILRSRVATTEAIGKAIGKSSQPPHVWLQASTATIYAHRFDAANDEESGILGETDGPWGFSIAVARAWERAVDEARTPRTRKVKMRTAIVMSPEKGGPFDRLLALVRYGLGGRAGEGRQFVSWVHHDDFVRAVRFLIDRPFVDGAVNIASPNPLPNAEFMEALRSAWGVRFGLPPCRRVLEIGAFILQTETELILKSRRVVPLRLLRHGFRFDHSSWLEAARALCDEWRALHGRPSTATRAEATW